jgi:hypothetical protein
MLIWYLWGDTNAQSAMVEYLSTITKFKMNGSNFFNLRDFLRSA